MIRKNIRITAEQSKKINELFFKENTNNTDLTEADLIRELIDIGLAYKNAKDKKSTSPLTAIEEQIFIALFEILSTQNQIAINTFDDDQKKYETPKDLIKDSIELSKKRLAILKEKLSQ